MEHVWILPILVYSVCTSVIGSNYYVTPYPGTWTDMVANCNIAAPELTFSGDEVLIQLENGTALETNENKLWVGYTKHYEVFRYIGCVPSNSIDTEAEFTLKPDIGMCYSACSKTGSKYFGVMLKHSQQNSCACKCVNTFHGQDVTKCGTGKNDPGDFAFGGTSRISLYELVSSELSIPLKAHPSWGVRNSNCFAYFDPTLHSFTWRSCSEASYHFLCTKEFNGLYSFNSKGASEWKIAADYCLHHNTNLSSYQLNINTTSKSQPWMANVRAKIISRQTDAPDFFRRYAYIEKTDHAPFKVKFGDENTGRFKALCLNADYGQNESPSVNNNKAGLYAGVSVAIVLVAGAIVIVVIILKRRQRPTAAKEVNNSKRNLTYEQPDANIIGKNVEDNADVYHEIDLNESTNEDYDFIKDGAVVDSVNQNDNSNNQYFVLEKRPNIQADETVNARSNDYLFAKETDPTVSKTTGTNVAPSMQSGASGNDYDFAKDIDATSSEGPKGNTEYEYATDTRQKTKGKQYAALEQSAGAEHIYNKAGNTTMVHNDYDHIERGRVGADNAAGDNPYDTTSQVKIQRDPTYDHAFV